jgi:hypothetical protein
LDELAEAAYAALSGTPPSARPRREPLSRRGRIRLELLADDGRVLADGEATAELIPLRGGTFA